MLRYLPRIVLMLICAAGTWYFFTKFSALSHAGVSSIEDPTQNAEVAKMGGNVLINMGAFIGLAVLTAIFLGMTILPMIGDLIGGAFYNPGGEIEKSPHRDAMAFIAQGDYEAAVAAYRKVIRENPADAHAVTEVVKLCLEKTNDPASAAEILEEAVQREWAPEEAASIASRLADVYWNHLNQPEQARSILAQIAEAMPGTRQAANANHRIEEIDKAIAAGESGTDSLPG